MRMDGLEFFERALAELDPSDGLPLSGRAAEPSSRLATGRSQPEGSEATTPAHQDSLDAYMEAVGRFRLLTGSEEQRLARQMAESRRLITCALATVPAAIEQFVAEYGHAKAEGRPLTEIFHLPSAAATRSKDADIDGGASGSHSRLLRRRRKATERIAEWTRPPASERARVTSAVGEAVRRGHRRVGQLFAATSPTFAVLERIIARCAQQPACSAAPLSSNIGRPGQGTVAAAGPDGDHRQRRAESAWHQAMAHAQLYREARRRLVEGNLRLVFLITRRYTNNGLSMRDLIQEGNLGLLHAAEKFDHRLGYKFSTYACLWIRQAITKALANSSRTVRLAAHVHHSLYRLNRLETDLLQRLGRDPSMQEIADEAGISLEQARDILATRRPVVPIDGQGDREHEQAPRDYLAQEIIPDPENSAESQQMTDHVGALLDSLPDRDALILRLRYGIGGDEPHTLEEIGRVIGVSRERTRQLEARAMERLRKQLATTA